MGTTKANLILQFCRICTAVTTLSPAQIASPKIQSVAPNASGPQMPIYNVCLAARHRQTRTLAVGREGRPRAERRTRTGTRRKRRAFAAFRARRRRRRDSVGEHRRQRPGAVASSNLSKALTIPSLPPASLPPSVFNSLLSTAGQRTCPTCLISSKETRRSLHVREGGRNRRISASMVVAGIVQSVR